ncbi:MAG: DUF6728 family protein [Cytophagaceae bacterium]
MNFKEFFAISEIFTYFFRKKVPNRPKNFNIKVMHGINRLSILMFLVGMLVVVIRAFLRS